MQSDRKIAFIGLSLIVVFLSSHLFAEPGGIYYGASATVQQAEVLYKKTVLGRRDGSDDVNSTRSSDTLVEDRPLQWDGLIGYRLNFGQGMQFMSLQTEISLVGDDISGRLDGSGDSPGRNLLGEAWPEDWRLETSRSIGVIAKYGIQRSLFGTIDFSLYGLFGVRQTRIDFFSSFQGCFLRAGCSVDDLRADTLSVDPEVNLGVAGIGFETGIGSKTALQFEIRYIEDFKSEWVGELTDEDFEIDAPAGLTIENTDFAVKLIRYL